jgi:hypothetical protein
MNKSLFIMIKDKRQKSQDKSDMKGYSYLMRLYFIVLIMLLLFNIMI